MTIHPHPRIVKGRKLWILGRNRMEVEDALRYGDTGMRKYAFDGYWSGEQWVHRTGDARHFGSESEALEYLETNLAIMEAPRATVIPT
jgi:hypothetical protein